jgi:hypothetical protein
LDILEKKGNLDKTSSHPMAIAANKATTSNMALTNFDNPIRLFMSNGETQAETNKWVIDSGATEHMCSHRDWFVSYHPLPVPKKVQLGNGAIIYAPGTGNVALNFNLDGETQQGLLRGVYYVPALQGNLFSLTHLTKRLHKTVFEDNACRVYNPAGQLTAIGRVHGNLFFLDATPLTTMAYITSLPTDTERLPLHNLQDSTYSARTTTSTASLEIWHRRLGHANLESVKRLEREEMVKGMQIHNVNTTTHPPCSSCLHGKQSRAPIPKRLDVTNPGLLHCVYSDVCGPMQTAALTGERYFSTFMDAKSHHVSVYLQKTKDQTLSCFQIYAPRAKIVTGERINLF